MKTDKSNLLFWAMAVPAGIDGMLTLIGQSPEYWAGNRAMVNEGSPAWRILAIHPAVFGVGSIVWLVGGTS